MSGNWAVVNVASQRLTVIAAQRGGGQWLSNACIQGQGCISSAKPPDLSYCFVYCPF